ncbi:hypothetical protein HMPREF0380_01478 [Eubacterium infirmum F0142]|nr:hypothetical protein HMPREF0380_01478 [Eubacterium infirmum F0142]
MLEEIKAYWYELKTEYEKRYGEAILRDFDKSKEYLEKMQSYLLAKQEECPSNVDVACTLASVNLELSGDEDGYVEFLENFLEEFDSSLDDKDKARIYTNIAFCEDYSKKALEYLTKACELKSPFAETYTALGLYNFSEYEYSGNVKNLELSREFFETAKGIDESYESAMNYAVSLYELKQYEEAREIFSCLYKSYPDRMWLKLCIAYCEVNLGNKDEAMHYIEQIEPDSEDGYYLTTNDIADFQIFDAYYVLEEYDKFLEYCDEEVDENYYIIDCDYLFYTLWIKGKLERFKKLEDNNRTYLEEALKESLEDEYDSEEEKKETIEGWEKDLKEFEEMISSIKSDAPRPEVKLKLYPEYSCFMVDCVRHKF